MGGWGWCRPIILSFGPLLSLPLAPSDTPPPSVRFFLSSSPTHTLIFNTCGALSLSLSLSLSLLAPLALSPPPPPPLGAIGRFVPRPSPVPSFGLVVNEKQKTKYKIQKQNNKSMMGLQYLDVSIYQMLRGSGIIFVALMKQHVLGEHLVSSESSESSERE